MNKQRSGDNSINIQADEVAFNQGISYRDAKNIAEDVVFDALLPLTSLIWDWVKIEEFVRTSVEKILSERQVPPEHIQSPDPDVAIPTVEALRYSKLHYNYAALLATSMDKETANNAHPAFAEILKQLTPDEARILRFLPRVGLAEPVLNVTYDVPEAGRFILLRFASMIGEDAACQRPDFTPAYIDNLCRLGLTSVPEGRGLFELWRYDRIRGSQKVQLALRRAPSESKTGFEYRHFGITNLGDDFRRACIIEPPREAVSPQALSSKLVL